MTFLQIIFASCSCGLPPLISSGGVQRIASLLPGERGATDLIPGASNPFETAVGLKAALYVR